MIIAKAGEPFVELIAVREDQPQIKLGLLKGKVWISPDFDEPDQAVIDSFYDSKLDL